MSGSNKLDVRLQLVQKALSSLTGFANGFYSLVPSTFICFLSGVFSHYGEILIAKNAHICKTHLKGFKL